jgi:hypothetical protein
MNGLPETGVSDAATWQTLLGEGAQPADLLDLRAKNAQYDDDMSGHNGSVWLLVRIWVHLWFEAPACVLTAPSVLLPIACNVPQCAA